LGARNIVRTGLSFNVNAVSSNAKAQVARSWESYLYLGFKPAVAFYIPAIKGSTGRTPMIGKAWFAIFVCLTTKALYIEAVTDLTTKAFIAVFQRFIARLSKPTDLYSDNGTTFHGSKRVLDEMRLLAMEERKDENLANFFANEGVLWHFIPPSTPHFGGIWEAGVWSV